MLYLKHFGTKSVARIQLLFVRINTGILGHPGPRSAAGLATQRTHAKSLDRLISVFGQKPLTPVNFPLFTFTVGIITTSGEWPCSSRSGSAVSKQLLGMVHHLIIPPFMLLQAEASLQQMRAWRSYHWANLRSFQTLCWLFKRGRTGTGIFSWQHSMDTSTALKEYGFIKCFKNPSIASAWWGGQFSANCLSLLSDPM